MARPMDDYTAHALERAWHSLNKRRPLFSLSSGTNFHPTKVKRKSKKDDKVDYILYIIHIETFYIHLQEVEPDPGELDINEKKDRFVPDAHTNIQSKSLSCRGGGYQLLIWLAIAIDGEDSISFARRCFSRCCSSSFLSQMKRYARPSSELSVLLSPCATGFFLSFLTDLSFLENQTEKN